RDSRGRGPLPASGARARPEEAGGAAAPDPGDPPRSRDPRADLRARVHLGRQSAGRGARDQPDPELRLLGALRGSQAQTSVTIAARSALMPPDYQMLQGPQKQMPHRNCAALPRTAKGLGRVKTKSDLVVMPCPKMNSRTRRADQFE